ncbi:SIMPL domain-containing protein [Roseibium sp. RKSG952]|uniref:SIMPL domain-containing protein n=1 Tax=Roseibium sp. RKSG952 TaxID=2529384 RepID=UPI001AD8A210|nr:SIMPL domain-containing protein [Roseibium sp. RKSG952]
MLPVMLVALGTVFSPLSAAADQAAPVATISIDGRGQVTAAPDMAVVTTRVVTRSEEAPDALSENTAAISKVIEDIKSAGIDAKDIQTSGFSIYPRYDRSPQSQNQPPKIDAYEVTNGVTIKIRDLDKLGKILNTVVQSGANSVGGISFQISDPQDKLDEARKAAVDDAKARAELYAEAAGVELGRVLSISEGGTASPRPVFAAREMMMKADSPVPIEAGENTLSANVSIIWEIEPSR